jgi:hypothetical protein
MIIDGIAVALSAAALLLSGWTAWRTRPRPAAGTSHPREALRGKGDRPVESLRSGAIAPDWPDPAPPDHGLSIAAYERIQLERHGPPGGSSRPA